MTARVSYRPAMAAAAKWVLETIAYALFVPWALCAGGLMLLYWGGLVDGQRALHRFAVMAAAAGDDEWRGMAGVWSSYLFLCAVAVTGRRLRRSAAWSWARMRILDAARTRAAAAVDKVEALLVQPLGDVVVLCLFTGVFALLTEAALQLLPEGPAHRSARVGTALNDGGSVPKALGSLMLPDGTVEAGELLVLPQGDGSLKVRFQEPVFRDPALPSDRPAMGDSSRGK